MVKKIVRNKLSNSYNMLLENVFKQMHAPLFFYASKFVDNSEVAKDLVQDAFLSIINHSKNNSEIENIKAYLYRSVRNNCLNYLKHKAIKNKFEKSEIERSQREVEFYDTHQTLVEKELQQKLNSAIKGLPSHYRKAFELSRFEDLTNNEIAKNLGLSVRTVETQIYRALKILKQKLREDIITLFLISKKNNSNC